MMMHDLIEETIEGTLDSNGQLQLTHQPLTAPGPVRVTIRPASPVSSQRGLVDVIREIRADQSARGFKGLTTDELRKRDAEIEAENIGDVECCEVAA
ncbi:MAG: hypothetical protein QM703_23985 [Gemmatales bacterium]